ncbi:MAG TPA: zinc metalloprotease HtpX [Candidatus Acidoferrales bacterium]|nr:zinc metalloprotease HtpX [Candidatus Acidoferrales bacterium]
MSNGIKTVLLLGLLTGLIMGFGQMLGGTQGLAVAFVFAVAMNFGSYWFSDKIVLAMYGARPVDMNEAPDLYRVVHNLATRAQIPMPKLYVIPSEAANAFATGRSPQHAAVAVTEGIMRLMSWEEIEGVIAHELSHVRNRDILISSVAATLAGVIMMLANMVRWTALFGGMSRDEREEGGGVFGLLAMSLLAPLAATLIQLAISRSREYQADASGAALIGSGEPLARALEKLEDASQRVPLDANPQTAHLFITNPLSGQSLTRLFSTHPPLQERIARLRGQRQ